MRQVFVLAVITIFSVSIAVQSQVFTVNEDQAPTYLFVLSAKSGKVEGDTLTLSGVPNAVYFSDRPNRIAGHRSLESFTGLWDNASDSFKADPPNASLSMMGDHGADNVVVELVSAETQGDSVTFKIKVLSGKVQQEFGESALFIDSISISAGW